MIGTICADEKQKKASAQGRSAATDVTPNILKVMNAVIREATENISNMSKLEEEVAVVNPHDQPEFMHNLGFRYVVNPFPIENNNNNKKNAFKHEKSYKLS